MDEKPKEPDAGQRAAPLLKRWRSREEDAERLDALCSIDPRNPPAIDAGAAWWWRKKPLDSGN